MTKPPLWITRAEQEEGITILEIIRRERRFNVADNVIADSLEVSPKTFYAALRRWRAEGIDI